MKKTFILLASCLVLGSCTEQIKTKAFGGTTNIKVEPGYKVVEATWKKNDLWYLIEPMEDDYIPKTKIFKESSSFGVIQGKVVFRESK